MSVVGGVDEGYKPEELFDGNGRLMPELEEMAPHGGHRMGANPRNGGVLLRDLKMPEFRQYAVNVPQPGQVTGEATRDGNFLRDIMKLNLDTRNFRVMGPDETVSNRLGALLDVTNRTWMADTLPEDDHLAPDGRVMETLVNIHARAG